LAESPVQGVKVNVFDGGLVPGAVGPILPRSALGLAHACPIGGLVSGAPKAVALHKGFQQIKAMAILGPPVTAKPSGNPTQNVAGQTRHPRPRHDQQTRVVGDEMKVLGPRRAIPADGGRARHTAKRRRQRARKPADAPGRHRPDIAGSPRRCCGGLNNGADAAAHRTGRAGRQLSLHGSIRW